jgi:general secretion pathway protein K
MVSARVSIAKRRVTKHHQRGVALITVMLVFVIVAVIATQMLRRSQLNVRSVGNLIETRQAYYYALGGEAYARQLLAKDAMSSQSNVDTLDEAWALAKDQQPFEIDDGSMKIEINDLQGRFNLNSVVADAQGVQINGIALEQFKRLLAELQLNPNYAYLWLDWIDRDQTRSANGAEDADYANYQTAARPESDISALRLLNSMQPQDYAKLAPHVTVLPFDVTAINVNTADDVVLRSISPTLSAQAAQIIARQKTGGYRDINEVPGAAGAGDVVSVSSNFFEVIVTVNYANRWQRVRTVLERKRSSSSGQMEITVLSRVRSPLIDDLDTEI